MADENDDIEVAKDTVEDATEEAAEEETIDDGDDSNEAAEQPVEEIHTTGAKSAVSAPRKVVKEDDPSPLETDPYDYKKCTITIAYTRLPDGQVSVSIHNHTDEPLVKTFPLAYVPLPDQVSDVMEKLQVIWPTNQVSATMVLLPTDGESERQMVISVRSGSDTPLVQAGWEYLYALPSPITDMLGELKELLPTRAMARLEKEAKAKAKTLKSSKSTKPVAKPSAQAAKDEPAVVDGKTQMSLFGG